MQKIRFAKCASVPAAGNGHSSRMNKAGAEQPSSTYERTEQQTDVATLFSAPGGGQALRSCANLLPDGGEPLRDHAKHPRGDGRPLRDRAKHPPGGGEPLRSCANLLPDGGEPLRGHAKHPRGDGQPLRDCARLPPGGGGFYATAQGLPAAGYAFAQVIKSRPDGCKCHIFITQ